MWILAFETAGHRGGAGLGLHGAAVAASYLEGRGVFARHLVELAADLLRQHDLEPSDLAAVASAIGPGSLTGLRIGLAAASALAYATHLPVIPIGNLEALAFKHRRDGVCLAAWLEAGPERVYHALYRCTSGDVSEVRAPAVASLEAALEQAAAAELLVLGGRASRFRPQILARQPSIELQEDQLNLVETVVELGSIRFGQGRSCPPERLRALYLRDLGLRRPD